MNRYHLLQYTFAILTLFLGTGQRVVAQEDESWHKENLRQWHQQYDSKVKANSLPKSSRTAQTNGTMGTLSTSVCDLGVNGDFESQRTPPTKTNNMGGDYGGTNTPDELNNWYSPTAGTPDYYSETASSTYATMKPSMGIYGAFTPRSPQGAIGLYARQTYTDTGGDRDRVAEYATVNLPNTNGLAPGQYYLEFYVSLSQNRNIANCGINQGFGCALTSTLDQVRSSGRDFINPTGPRVLSGALGQSAVNLGPSGNANWQRVSGQFQGGGEKYMTFGLFNSDRNNFATLPDGSTAFPNAYFFLDDVQLFKIPTAGASSTIPCGGSAILGEGCAIPGATYAWQIGGGAVFSTSLQPTVTPGATTTYTLTVTLPDGSISASTVTVTINGSLAPATPLVTQYDVQEDYCLHMGHFRITNYNPSLTYTINRGVGNPTPNPLHPTSELFWVKVSGSVTYATFTVTATSACGVSNTTGPISVDFPCYQSYSVSPATAYPNPVTESIMVPSGTESAVLLNDKGKAVKAVNGSGKIDVQSLPDGLYNLQMRQNGKLINQRIEVKH